MLPGRPEVRRIRLSFRQDEWENGERHCATESAGSPVEEGIEMISLTATSSGVAWRRLVIAAAILLCCAPAATAQLRVRRDYRELTPAQRLKVRDAIVAMKMDETDSGKVGQCSAPMMKAGEPCTEDVNCDSAMGANDGLCGICEWNNRYDKFVCWHDKCG